jgi:hypothetical protein
VPGRDWGHVTAPPNATCALKGCVTAWFPEETLYLPDPSRREPLPPAKRRPVLGTREAAGGGWGEGENNACVASTFRLARLRPARRPRHKPGRHTHAGREAYATVPCGSLRAPPRRVTTSRRCCFPTPFRSVTLPRAVVRQVAKGSDSPSAQGRRALRDTGTPVTSHRSRSPSAQGRWGRFHQGNRLHDSQSACSERFVQQTPLPLRRLVNQIGG